LHQRNWIS